MEFVVFILASLGLTFIVTLSYLFRGFREFWKSRSKFLYKLLNCPMCFGVYSGWMVQSVVMLRGGEWNHLEWGDCYFILYGFISSFLCYLTYLLMLPLIKKYDS